MKQEHFHTHKDLSFHTISSAQCFFRRSYPYICTKKIKYQLCHLISVIREEKKGKEGGETRYIECPERARREDAGDDDGEYRHGAHKNTNRPTGEFLKERVSPACHDPDFDLA